MAQNDPLRMPAIARWPLREVFISYLQIVKELVREQYNISLQVWASKTAFGGKVKPPEMPKILRD